MSQPEIDEEYLEFLEEERGVDVGLVPDRVLPLAKSKYKTERAAEARFTEIQHKHGYILIGRRDDARNWVFLVLDRRS